MTVPPQRPQRDDDDAAEGRPGDDHAGILVKYGVVMRSSKSKSPAGRKKSVRRKSRAQAAKAVALKRLRDPVKRLAVEHDEDVARRPKRSKQAAAPRSELTPTHGPVAPARGVLEPLGRAQAREASSKEVEPQAPIISVSDGNVFGSMFASQMQLFATLLRWPVGLLLQQQALLAQLVLNHHYPRKVD